MVNCFDRLEAETQELTEQLEHAQSDFIIIHTLI